MLLKQSREISGRRYCGYIISFSSLIWLFEEEAHNLPHVKMVLL